MSIRVDGEIHTVECVHAPEWYEVRKVVKGLSLPFPIKKIEGKWRAIGPAWHPERAVNVRALDGEYL
jgi:hypothetical protein